MRIDLRKVPLEGLSIDAQFPATWLEGELDDDARLEEPGVELELRVTPVGKDYLLQGRVRATLLYDCHRCLDAARQPLDQSFTLLCGDAPTPSASDEEDVELSDEDLDFLPVENGAVEMDEAVREQLVLAIPMVRLCSEDCRGLCPNCGQNLNHQSCACEAEPVDPRWAALAAPRQSDK